MSTIPDRLARTLRGVAGIAALIAAAALAPRPLATLELSLWVVCAGMILWAALLLRHARRRPWAWLAAALLLAGAVTAFVFTPAVLRLYPALIVVAFAASALRLLLRVVRGRGEPGRSRAGAVLDRVTDAAFAVSSAAAAVLTWLWPDVALLLLAWALAVAAGIWGIVIIVRAIRPHRVRVPGRGRRIRRALRLSGAVLATSVVALGSAGSAWASAQVAQVDDFYAWRGPVPATPGQLLRVGAYDGEVPPGARALRILYATTRADGSAAVASAVVAVPTAPAGAEGRAVLAWQHGTTGVARSCAPSLAANALSEYAIPGISRMIERGWIVVATDYPGMGTDGRYPYLIGAGEGRASLDGVRAVQALSDADASRRVMLWGHSQGGHATLWAAQIAADYAPELQIVDVAALSSATDPLEMARRVTGATASALASAVTAYVVIPYTDEYPDLPLAALTHPAGATFAEAAATRCATDPGTIVTLLVTLGLGHADRLYDLDLDSGPVHDRLAENIASGIVPAPLFLGQGVSDQVVPIDIQRATSARACAAGRPVVTREYPGYDHMGVIGAGSPLIDDLFAWADEVAGGAAPSTCG